MTSKNFQDVAAALAEALEDAPDARLEKLAKAMAVYEAFAPRSIVSLLRVPGFADLWEAMNEATEQSSLKLAAMAEGREPSREGARS